MNKRTISLSLLLAGMLLLPTTAQAQVVATLTQSLLSAGAGTTVTYQATIQNQSATQDYFLNGLGFSFQSSTGDPQDVIQSVSGNSFLDYFEAYSPTRRLAAGATYTGNLVNVVTKSDAPYGATDQGNFLLQGGITNTGNEELASILFSITIIPEASSLGLAFAGAGVFGVIYAARFRRIIRTNRR